MNIFTDILFIFVFVFIILHFKLIDITSQNVVTQKTLMFVSVTIFASLLYAIKSIRHNKPINTWDVINSGVIIGILSFIGHTFLFDMWYMKESSEWLKSHIDEKYITLNVILTFYICILISFGKFIGYIFDTEY